MISLILRNLSNDGDNRLDYVKEMYQLESTLYKIRVNWRLGFTNQFEDYEIS